MQLSHITETVIHHLFGRLLLRTIGAVLVVLFTFIAIYHLTVAGTQALGVEYGLLYARLIVAAIYAAAALTVLTVLWATRTKLLVKDQAVNVPVSPLDMQIAALIKAAMVGYALAQKSGDPIK